MSDEFKNIRKRFLGMRWMSQQENLTFGFENIGQAIPYYMKNGQSRPCAYCGRIPETGKVWGLDRVKPSLGYVPGNLVPCCSSHFESPQLSCQGSKSKFSLLSWMERSMSRANGGIVPFAVVKQRLEIVYALAKELKDASIEAEKE